MDLFAWLMMVLVFAGGGAIVTGSKPSGRQAITAPQVGYEVFIPWRGDDDAAFVAATGNLLQLL